MLNESVHKAILELAEEVEKILSERIEAYGTNPRTGSNTLQGSNLEKSIKVIPQEDGIALQIADYWEFVSRGWARTHNYSGTFPQMLNNILKWIVRKGIRQNGYTENQLAWAIAMHIFNNGIAARPFMVYDDNGELDVMIPELKAYMQQWLDNLFEAIISDLDKYFNE